jgi:hypothetical protein
MRGGAFVSVFAQGFLMVRIRGSIEGVPCCAPGYEAWVLDNSLDESPVACKQWYKE